MRCCRFRSLRINRGRIPISRRETRALTPIYPLTPIDPGGSGRRLTIPLYPQPTWFYPLARLRERVGVRAVFRVRRGRGGRRGVMRFAVRCRPRHPPHPRLGACAGGGDSLRSRCGCGFGGDRRTCSRRMFEVGFECRLPHRGRKFGVGSRFRRPIVGLGRQGSQRNRALTPNYR